MIDTHQKSFRILSIDGGGIRGIIPALFLASIEKTITKPIGTHFDLICGTSTGGIIALAVALGIPMEKIVSLYEQKGSSIFQNGLLRKTTNIIRYCSQYNKKNLKKELDSLFSDKKMSDLNAYVLIPSSNITTRNTKTFKSPHNVIYPKKELFQFDAKYFVTDVALATSSAPFFFYPQKIDNHYFWDGGLWANNPTICGLIEAKRIYNYENVKIEILSLGTGFYKPLVVQNKLQKLKKYYTLLNPSFFITYILDIQSSAVDNQIKMLIDTNTLYSRINCDLPCDMGLADYKTIPDLKAAAQAMTHTNIAETINKFFKNERTFYGK